MAQLVQLEVRPSDTARPAIRALVASLRRRRPLLAEVSTAVKVELQDHFGRLNEKPNKKNWPKKNFFNREGRRKTAVTTLTETEAAVTVDSPAMAHRFLGGEVTPKRGKYLAIPLRASAYVKGSPKAWDKSEEPGKKLIPMRFAGKGEAGPRGLYLVTKNKRGNITVQYLLVPKVKHDPDPSTLPSDTRLQQVIGTAVDTYAERIIRRRQTGASPTTV